MKLRRQSPFHQIIVHDSGGTRTLQFGSTIQSTMRIDDPMSGLEYIEFFHLALLLREVRKSLFIGLGGASGPKQFCADYPQMTVDVVEIDPEVIRVAQELFGFTPSSRCRVHEGGGFSFLEESRRRWDLIVVDAYTTDRGRLAVPRELSTPEFFELATRRLTAGGLLLFNCADGAESRMSRRIHAAMAEVFPALLTFESSTAENTVIIGSHQPLEQRSTHLIERLKRTSEPALRERRGLARRCRQIHRSMSRNA